MKSNQEHADAMRRRAVPDKPHVAQQVLYYLYCMLKSKRVPNHFVMWGRGEGGGVLWRVGSGAWLANAPPIRPSPTNTTVAETRRFLSI